MGKDVYSIITEQIIEKLESGVVPWHQPWSGANGASPRNLISNKPYRGINVFLLGFQGYESPYWVSFNQCKKAGGKVKKGSKSSMAVFWKWFDAEESDPSDPDSTRTVKRPFLRYYRVFNTEQCEGISHKRVKELRESETDTFDFDPIEACESVVSGMPNAPQIEHIENRAYYRPSTDTVNMPKAERFELTEEYYSVLFHELCHSTGHESRLNRRPSTEIRAFGDREYSQEELVAEMGAAFLCGVTGIENKTIDNSAAYLDNWLGVLTDKKNRKLLVMAGAQAQKAADCIQGITFD